MFIWTFLFWNEELTHENYQSIFRYTMYKTNGGTWRSWLRHCATSWKVAGLIPDSVIGIFHWHNPSGCTMALRSTQPLTEMSTRNIPWGVKAASVQGWQPYHLHVPFFLKSGSLNVLEPSGPVQACDGIALPLPFYKTNMIESNVLSAQLKYVFNTCSFYLSGFW
jgi:hypothetical protein